MSRDTAWVIKHDPVWEKLEHSPRIFFLKNTLSARSRWAWDTLLSGTDESRNYWRARGFRAVRVVISDEVTP